MPACTTPLLWPVWCWPIASSFSNTARRNEGYRSSTSRAVASPMIPPPASASGLHLNRGLSRHQCTQLRSALACTREFVPTITTSYSAAAREDNAAARTAFVRVRTARPAAVAAVRASIINSKLLAESKISISWEAILGFVHTNVLLEGLRWRRPSYDHQDAGARDRGAGAPQDVGQCRRQVARIS